MDRSNRLVRSIYSCFERALAISLFCVAVPILLALALGIWFFSKSPPFVAHRRVGQFGRTLWVLKVRSLWEDSVAVPPDRRWLGLVEYCDTTSAGKPRALSGRVAGRLMLFLRRSSLDEAPQFLQVAMGDMALVGPRPITQAELSQHYGDAQDIVLSVRPGMSGLWQVSGRSRLSYIQRRCLDLYYVQNRSVRYDLQILLRSVIAVLSMDGSQ